MAPSPTIRRLLRETAELSPTAPRPNPAFYAQPVSDSDLHEWHFILLGPPAPSPYAGGLYHGRITLPPTYPLKPPNFRFLTPSGRFETNREICLSISGFHEETWMPAWGVRTALTALRTFMAEQGTAGQVGGLEASKEVRQRLAGDSRVWRCEGCGGRTNAEIMAKWWDACKEKGVSVGKDGEEVDLEVLPEGVDLVARDRGKDAETEDQDSPEQRDSNSTPQDRTPDSSDLQNPQDSALKPTAIPLPPHADAVAMQWMGESSVPLIRQRHPTTSHELSAPPAQQAAPASGPSQTAQQRLEVFNNMPGNSVSLDRAISAIGVLLCLMILKKIFYPASTSSLDEFNLPEG